RSAGGSSKKPKGPVSAYAFFVRNCWAEWKQEGSEKLSFADQSKKCAELWKVVPSPKGILDVWIRFEIIRHEKEMRSYVPPTGTTAAKGAGNVPVKGVKVKRMKKVKDPNAPKRALSAFFWFGHDERAKVKGANPEFGIGDVPRNSARCGEE
ncbi:High mobility group protein DSP1, partial [Orchesella cincta]